MHQSVLIRVLAKADAPGFRLLRLRALRERPDAFTSSYEEDVLQPVEAAAARLADPLQTLWGAFVGDDLAGFAGLERSRRAKASHKATVAGMFVAPEHAGRGLGRALLQALMAQARAEALQSLVLTVTQGNAGAQRLYESAGFRAFGTEPRAVVVDGLAYAKVHMHCDLAAAAAQR